MTKCNAQSPSRLIPYHCDLAHFILHSITISWAHLARQIQNYRLWYKRCNEPRNKRITRWKSWSQGCSFFDTLCKCPEQSDSEDSRDTEQKHVWIQVVDHLNPSGEKQEYINAHVCHPESDLVKVYTWRRIHQQKREVPFLHIRTHRKRWHCSPWS